MPALLAICLVWAMFAVIGIITSVNHIVAFFTSN